MLAAAVPYVKWAAVMISVPEQTRSPVLQKIFVLSVG